MKRSGLVSELSDINAYIDKSNEELAGQISLFNAIKSIAYSMNAMAKCERVMIIDTNMRFSEDD